MDYVELKNGIKRHLNSAAEDFFMVGYYLRQVSDRALFLEDGYRNIWEFAKGEYGLSTSSASRFMAINERFSIDGGEHMDQRFIGMGPSKLQEMLQLGDDDLNKITRDTTVREIRAIKAAKNSCDVATENDCIEAFYNTCSDNDKRIIKSHWRPEITRLFRKEYGLNNNNGSYGKVSWNCHQDNICFVVDVGGDLLQFAWDDFTHRLITFLDCHPHMEEGVFKKNYSEIEDLDFTELEDVEPVEAAIFEPEQVQEEPKGGTYCKADVYDLMGLYEKDLKMFADTGFPLKSIRKQRIIYDALMMLLDSMGEKEVRRYA